MGDGPLGSDPRKVSKKEGLGWVNWIDGSKRLSAAKKHYFTPSARCTEQQRA